MPTTRKRGAAVAVATLGLLLSGALAGCSLSKDDGRQARHRLGTRSRRRPPTATDQATETPSAGDADPDGQRSASAKPEPAAALLGAAELPALNASSPWTEGARRCPVTTPFGLCQKFDAALDRRR